MYLLSFDLIPLQAIKDALAVSFLVTILVMTDIATKWLYLAKKFNNDKQRPNTVFNIVKVILFTGWQEDYFQSSKLNSMLTRKLIPYSVIISMGCLVNALPHIRIMGIMAHEVVCMFLYLCVVFCELFSITENLRNLGFYYANFLLKVCEQAITRVLGLRGEDISNSKN